MHVIARIGRELMVKAFCDAAIFPVIQIIYSYILLILTTTQACRVGATFAPANMARGGRPQRGAKRGAPARPGPRYRQTKLNFSRQRSRPEIRQPSQTDRDTMVSFSEPEYAQADSTDEESEDKDSVVRRQVKAREPLRGATTHDARWRKHMESGQNAKNSGLESFNTLRIRETDMSEDGEVEDEWDREVQTGEIPPYPVRRPYYLGGMGRYGIDSKRRLFL